MSRTCVAQVAGQGHTWRSNIIKQYNRPLMGGMNHMYQGYWLVYELHLLVVPVKSLCIFVGPESRVIATGGASANPAILQVNLLDK